MKKLYAFKGLFLVLMVSLMGVRGWGQLVAYTSSTTASTTTTGITASTLSFSGIASISATGSCASGPRLNVTGNWGSTVTSTSATFTLTAGSSSFQVTGISLTGGRRTTSGPTNGEIDYIANGGSNVAGTSTSNSTTCGATTISANSLPITISAGNTLVVKLYLGGGSSTGNMDYTDIRVTGSVLTSPPTKLAFSTITSSTVSPIYAGTPFSIILNSQDGSSTNSAVTSTTAGSLSASTGTISPTTYSITSGSSSQTQSVTLSTAGTGISLTAAQPTSGMTTLTAGTSNTFTVYSAIPTTVASAVTGSAASSSSANVNWTNGNGAGRILVARLSTTAAAAPTIGTAYSAGTTIYGTTQIGSSGNYVVYSGTGNTTSISGLTAATGYVYDVYEYNGSGATISYAAKASSTAIYTLSTAPTGNPANFTATATDQNNIGLSFSAASTVSASGYLIFQRTGSSPTTFTPVNANSYMVGTTYGDGKLTANIVSTSLTSATISSLTANTQYSYTIVPYSWDGTNASTYNYYTTSNKTATATTSALTVPNAPTIGTATAGNASATVTFGTPSSTGGSPITSYTVTSSPGGITATGTSTSIIINGLTNGTAYNFTVYATNAQGNSSSSAPSNSVTPVITYCTPSGGSLDGISGVIFNTISNTGTGNNSYTNYTATQATTVTVGSGYNLNVYVNTGGNYTNSQKVWIDWNQDGVFNTAAGSNSGLGEEYMLGTATNVTNGLSSLCPFSITVPTGASIGNTVMRVSSKFNGYTTSCATGIDGEFEDYRITIIANNLPVLTTTAISNLAVNSASSGGIITADGGSSVISRGVVWNTSTGPTISLSTKTSDGTGTGSYTSSLTGLADNTTYYVRAYATNANGTSYGNEVTFTTPSVSAPTANPTTAITSTGFTTNWSAVTGANSYKLDVSTNNFPSSTNIETFTNVGGGTTSSYLTRSWIGDGGINWTAEKSRIDQTIVSSNAAITLQDAADAYILSGTINGNPGTISFDIQQKFTGSGGSVILTILSGPSFSVSTNVGTYTFNTTASTKTATISGINGPYRIRIDNNATTRPCIDNLAFILENANYVSGYQDSSVIGTSHSVIGLAPSTTYYFRVRAVGSNSTSGNSNIITVTTRPDTYYPKTTATDLSNPANWTSDVGGGSGVAPADFTSPGQTFSITRNAVVLNPWTITGGSNVILNIAGLDFKSGSRLTVGTGSTVNFNNLAVTLRSVDVNTASIGSITGTLSNATNVTVERYISAKRSYRLLTPAVTSSQTYRAAWMEGQNDAAPAYSQHNNGNPGYGTHITGAGGATKGFDETSTNAASLFTYDNNTQKYLAAANTTDAGVLKPGKGYRLFVRGSRAIDLSSNNPTPTSTILRVMGTLNTGTFTFPTADVPLSNVAAGYSFVGNPYASPVSWSAVGRSNIASTYYAYDPKINARGAFVNYNSFTHSNNNSSSQVNDTLQSGEAFFVQSNSAGAMLSFTEASKTSGNANVFRTSATTTALSIKLLLNTAAGGQNTADGARALFDDTFSPAIGDEDSYKLANVDENLAIMHGNINLSIEAKPTIKAADTLQIKMWQFRNSKYFLRLDGSNFEPSTTAFVKDAFLHTETPVNLADSTLIPFSITTDSASAAIDRFTVIFKSAAILPVTVTDVNAAIKGKGIQVNWISRAETNIDRYEIERSVTGQQFEKSTTIKAKGNNGVAETYTWFDENVTEGVNYYRIRVIDKSGAIAYTQIVKATISKISSSITVYPNPVKGSVINLHFIGMEKGRYTVTLYNNAGQKIYTTIVEHTGLSATYPVKPGRIISKGTYRLQASNGEKVINTQVAFE